MTHEHHRSMSGPALASSSQTKWEFSGTKIAEKSLWPSANIFCCWISLFRRQRKRAANPPEDFISTLVRKKADNLPAPSRA